MTNVGNTDSIEIKPLRQPLNATVRVPGSKSITNRALAIAALADGETILKNVLFSDDSRRFMESLERMGFHLQINESERTVVVDGESGKIPAGSISSDVPINLFVGNAGTAARFLTAFVSLGSGTYRIDGIPRMRQRPIQDLLDALVQLGADAVSELGTGCPPVLVRANGMQGGTAVLDGSRSSQYLSAILLAAPYAKSDVTIQMVGELIALPYVNMTLRMMESFGVTTIKQSDRQYQIPAWQKYRAQTYTIEPDTSNASYFYAAAAITGGTVRVEGVSRDSLQGDTQFVHVLEKMGCIVRFGAGYVEVTGPKDGHLVGIDIDLNEMSDMAQTLAAIAPFADSPVTIRNIGHIRIQETDRIHAVATELRKLSINVTETEDSLYIEPGDVKPAEIDTYDDHRMAMAFSVIGLRVPGIKINDPGCVGKTFPEYFEILNTLHG